METEKSLSPEAVRKYLNSPDFRARYRHVPDHVAAEILRYGSPVGSLIECHDRISRCMERLQAMIADAEAQGRVLPSGTTVMAYELRNGSGRFNRIWHAPRGGLWMAVALADTLLPEYARLLPLATGTACCEAVRSYGIEAAVKWVNDIHVHGRKIGGILCETHSTGVSRDSYHLLGIGINCNVEEFPDELRDSAVSMHEILKTPVNLDSFALNLLATLQWNLGLVHLQEAYDLENRDGEPLAHEKKSMVIGAWRQLSDTLGRRVRYGYDVVRQPLYSARVIDIDPTGGLVMELDDGSRVTEYSGEIIYLE